MNSVETQPEPPQTQHRRIGINFVSLASLSVIQRLLGVISGVYLRRTLQVTAIGQFNWAASVISYFSILVNPNLEIIAQREVAKDYSKTAHYVSLTIGIELMMASISVVVIAILAALNLRGQVVNNLLLIQAIALIIVPVDIAWVLYVRERMFLVAATELGQQIMQLVCLFALVHDPSHVYRYAIIPIPIRVITAAFRMWYSVKCGFLNLADIKLTLKGGFTFFKEAAPLGLSQVAIALYYNCDSILLGIFKGETAVGIYATAYSLMLVSISISGALTGSYAPSLARSTSDPALFSKLSNELLETLCWFGLPLSTLGLATGRGAIQFLYGSGFAESGPVFELLCLNIACIFFSVGVGQPSIAAGWQKQVFYATTAGGVANLCLNLWLIPRFGIGAAIATTVIAEFIVGATICYMRRDLLRVEFLHSVFPSLATAVVVGAMAKAGFAIFHLPWWLCAGTGGTLAALCAFRFAHSAFIAKIGGRVSSLVGIKLVR